MREYKQFVNIPDYLYSCRNLDNDERVIIAVVMSYENDNKKLYMSKATFAETYGMSISTVKRKFASLIKDGILKDTGKGLKIDWSELDFRLAVKKVMKTKKAGPGRKPKQNHNDTTQNHNDSIPKMTEQNHVEPSQNHNDTTGGITVIPRENHNDTQLIKLEKELKKDIIEEDNVSFFVGNNYSNNGIKNSNQEYLDSKKKELVSMTPNDLDDFLNNLDI